MIKSFIRLTRSSDFTRQQFQNHLESFRQQSSSEFLKKLEASKYTHSYRASDFHTTPFNKLGYPTHEYDAVIEITWETEENYSACISTIEGQETIHNLINDISEHANHDKSEVFITSK